MRDRKKSVCVCVCAYARVCMREIAIRSEVIRGNSMIVLYFDLYSPQFRQVFKSLFYTTFVKRRCLAVNYSMTRWFLPPLLPSPSPLALLLRTNLRSSLLVFFFAFVFPSSCVSIRGGTPVTLQWNERERECQSESESESEIEKENRDTCPRVSTLCVVFPKDREKENSAKEETGKRCRRRR